MAMDSSSAQSHHQEMGSQTLESMLVCTKSQQEKKPRPADQQALKCPRCESTNTKFCYYNNYSLSQPRYFCKSCRRYWTKGGTLRNIPVGGGCRKNKRSSSSSSQSSASSKRIHDQPITRSIPSPTASINPFSYELGLDVHGFPMSGNPNMPLSDSGLFDALRGGFLETPRGFHNLYYGMEDGVNLGLDNPGMGLSGNQEMGLMGFEELIISSGATATSTAVTTVKQEMCSNIGREGAEMNRGLWGFPWQNIVSGDGNMGDLDSTRLGSWNGIASSNWHGLLNSPLM